MVALPFGSSLCLAAAAATLLLALAIKQALGAAKGAGRARARRLRLPPGPWNLPVIGSLHHLVGGEVPHRALLRLSRRHGALMLVRLGQVPTVVVSSPEAAMEVLKAKDPVFASRPRGATFDLVSFGGRGIVLAPYGEQWRQARKLCVVELLSARQVQRMASIRQEEVARLVQSVSGGGAVNLTQRLKEMTNSIIARAVLGGGSAMCRQQEEYLRELDVVATLVGGLNLEDLFPSSRLVRWLSGSMRDLRRSHARIQRILDEIIQERRAERASAGGDDDEDLLDVMLRLQRDGHGALNHHVTEEIIAPVISDIFAAATDTTASTLEWAMAELVRNPNAMARAQQEVRQRLGQGRSTLTSEDLVDLHYLRMVIKEVLRLHPAATLILRASQQGSRVMGYDIPKGTAVSINVFAVARDPKYWNDAEEFKPERFENNGVDYKGAHLEFIPFGAGRRQCPGMLFATTTMELTLASLLYHFDWSLPGKASLETLDMGEVFGITVHRRFELLVQADLHNPSS